jgi:hypothetical protein
LLQLPRNPPNAGYYNYGRTDAQYGLPSTDALVGAAGSQWNATGAKPFGVGNMALSNGAPYEPHSATGDHPLGRGVDIRPIRKDGQQAGVSWQSPSYDREATQKLVDTLLSTGGVDRIFFNDPNIKGVSPQSGHDNHLHVRVNPSWVRQPSS